VRWTLSPLRPSPSPETGLTQPCRVSIPETGEGESSRRFAGVVAGLLLIALVLSSCATPRAENLWHQELLTADRDFDHQRYAEAKARYLTLKPSPEAELDLYIDLQLARIRVAEGDLAGGLETLKAIEDAASETEEWASQARSLRAELAELDGDLNAAMQLYDSVIVDYPSSATAQRAFDRVLRSFDEVDSPALGVQWLAELHQRLEMNGGEATLADNVLYEMAKLFHDKLGDDESAIKALETLLETAPMSPLQDDATFLLAQIARTQGRAQEALALFERIAREHDASWAMGEYDSALRDDAMLARVEIFLSLGEGQAAVDEYQRILDAFPGYLGRARIAFERATLLREALGDEAAYRAALEELVADYPESVYAEKAAAILTQP